MTDLYVYISNYSTGDTKNNQFDSIFQAIYRKMQESSVTHNDRLQVLFKNFVKFAQTDTQILKLKDWIMGDDPSLEGRQIFDKNLPWDIVKKVFSVSDSNLTK